ncbi:SLC13 family permease [Nocardiopsis sp. ARC36]
MTPQLLTILALLAMFVIATVLPINIGALAFVGAFLVGVLALGMDTDAILGGFPADLFLTLVGVTYLFAIAKNNGTIDLLVRAATRLVGGRVVAIPWIMFGISALLTGVGALSPAAVAIVAPIALGFAVKYRINPLLMGMMVIHGAQGAGSPRSASTARRSTASSPTAGSRSRRSPSSSATSSSTCASRWSSSSPWAATAWSARGRRSSRPPGTPRRARAPPRSPAPARTRSAAPSPWPPAAPPEPQPPVHPRTRLRTAPQKRPRTVRLAGPCGSTSSPPSPASSSSACSPWASASTSVSSRCP